MSIHSCYAMDLINFLVYFSVLLSLVNSQLLPTFGIPTFPVREYEDSGALFLTPYIEAGLQSTARRLAKVNSSVFLNTTSYAGYLTVDEDHNSNLFFWFFPSEPAQRRLVNTVNELESEIEDGETEDTDYDHEFLKKLSANSSTEITSDGKPVVLWLQGGPGVSSLFALFTENGPFLIEKNGLELNENLYSWHKRYHLLYIDSPVGTGFSFTQPGGYCETVSEVAVHMHRALVQFFKLFPGLQRHEFYMAGESFAGKYIPAIADMIYQQNANPQNYLKINLKGIVLGNAFSDPPNMMDYSDFAYQVGLIGRKGYQEMKLTESLTRTNIKDPKLAKAYWDTTIYLFLVHSNFSNLYNILQPEQIDLFPFNDFINQNHIREAIHVGKQSFSDPNAVYTHLAGDFMTTAMHWVERLLDAGLRVLYYSGNLDFIVAYPLSENAFHHMQWKGAEEYTTADRRPLLFNGDLHGYVTNARTFYEVSLLNAGHMALSDQPGVCLSLIDNFIEKKL